MDEEHEYTHKVMKHELEKYKKDPTRQVVSFCGKVWQPKLPIDISKPKCPQCFRATTAYAISA